MLTAMAVFAVLVLAWGSPRVRRAGNLCAGITRRLVPTPVGARAADHPARGTMSITKPS